MSFFFVEDCAYEDKIAMAKKFRVPKEIKEGTESGLLSYFLNLKRFLQNQHYETDFFRYEILNNHIIQIEYNQVLFELIPTTHLLVEYSVYKEQLYLVDMMIPDMDDGDEIEEDDILLHFLLPFSTFSYSQYLCNKLFRNKLILAVDEHSIYRISKRRESLGITDRVEITLNRVNTKTMRTIEILYIHMIMAPVDKYIALEYIENRNMDDQKEFFWSYDSRTTLNTRHIHEVIHFLEVLLKDYSTKNM